MPNKMVNGQLVEMSAPEMAALEAQRANFTSSKVTLPRWAFMQTLDEAGFTAAIETLIEALPAGAQKSRAQGKWKHDNQFDPNDADMIALSAVAAQQVPGFDFDALWTTAEALAFGGSE